MSGNGQQNPTGVNQVQPCGPTDSVPELQGRLASAPVLPIFPDMTTGEFSIQVDHHPILRPAAFTSRFPRPLGELPIPLWLVDLLELDADAPINRDEALRLAVRDMLRYWGHKPAGRGKPASEYLVRAVGEGVLESINAAVDVCNVVSLHSGFPIALVDLDLARPPFRVRPGTPEESYVFNASGQEMALKGLICLHDSAGPCANPVK
ncbi:MAG: hypothetical protein HKO65_03895, partial [Gemmatimonadetes bacterium]|nr:hypothetical protein [Gemmatimonadota bacterium]